MATSRRSSARSQQLTSRLTLETPLGAVLTEARVRLLEAIDRCGSLNRAAQEVPLSYKAAWDALDAMNGHSPEPLVERSTGGAGGGGTLLTGFARQLISLYRAMESSQQDVLDRLPTVPSQGDAPALRTLIRRMTMRSSARNQYACEVVGLSDRGGLIDVTLDCLDADSHPGHRLVATITPESAQSMGLALRSGLYALIKAPWVSVHGRAPKARADRNVLEGEVVELRPGPSHWGVSLQFPGGQRLEANVPAASAEGLAVGQSAWGSFATDSVVLVSFA